MARVLAAVAIVFCMGAHGGPKESSRADSFILQSPTRLALAHNDRIVVSDYGQQRVFTLDRRSLTIQRVFPVAGKPLGIAAWKNRLFVGNETRRRVEVYTPNGQWLFDLGDGGTTFTQPTDIAVDAGRNEVFVLDGRERAVRIFATDGRFLREFGGPSAPPSQIANPTGLGLDTVAQRVLVSDYGNPDVGIPPRVQVFDYNGNLLMTLSGKAGMFGLRFSRPQGLAGDGRGHLFLVDSLLGQVLVFDVATGLQLKTVGSFGSDPGQLLLPLDVVIDDLTNDLFVTNNRPGRIEVFAGGGQLP